MWRRFLEVILLFSLLHCGASWSQASIRTVRRRVRLQASTSTTLSPQEVSSRVFQNDSRPVILFDGVCNMCNSAVNLALDWDPNGRLRFSALQSNVGRSLLQTNGIAADDIRSIVIVTEDGAHIKSDAILKITESLAPPFLPTRPAVAVGRFLVPRLLRDLIYDGVADNRYRFMGKRDVCRLDSDDGQFADRFVDESVALRL